MRSKFKTGTEVWVSMDGWKIIRPGVVMYVQDLDVHNVLTWFTFSKTPTIVPYLKGEIILRYEK